MQLRSTISPSDSASPRELSLPIPPAIRQRLDLRPGQVVQWDLDPQGQLRLHGLPPAPAAPAQKKGARYC